MRKWQVQFCFHILRLSSPTPVPSGPALQWCSGEVEGPLSRVLQLVKGSKSSPTLVTSGGWQHSHLPQAARREVISSPPIPPYGRGESLPGLPRWSFQVVHRLHCPQDQLPSQGAVPLSRVLQLLSGRVKRCPPPLPFSLCLRQNGELILRSWEWESCHCPSPAAALGRAAPAPPPASRGEPTLLAEVWVNQLSSESDKAVLTPRQSCGCGWGRGTPCPSPLATCDIWGSWPSHLPAASLRKVAPAFCLRKRYRADPIDTGPGSGLCRFENGKAGHTHFLSRGGEV